jgi:hypothetical protein
MPNLKYSVDTDKLRELYDSGLTLRQIAPIVGVPARTINRYMRAAGVNLRSPGTPTIPALTDEAWLRREYLVEGKSTPVIAREIGCGIRTVASALKRHGIAARNVGSEKGHKRSTDAARQKMSAARRGKYLGPDNPHWKGGITLKDPDRNRYQSKMWVKAVKDRDGWQCTKCGATERLHAHHIKRWRDYPELRYDVSNGVTLCHDHHEEAHGRGFKFRWPKKVERPTSAPVPHPEG